MIDKHHECDVLQLKHGDLEHERFLECWVGIVASDRRFAPGESLPVRRQEAQLHVAI